MLQTVGELELAHEAFDPDSASELGREDLKDYLTPEAGLFGNEHARHRTAVELALKEVRAPPEAGLELVAELGLWLLAKGGGTGAQI